MYKNLTYYYHADGEEVPPRQLPQRCGSAETVRLPDDGECTNNGLLEVYRFIILGLCVFSVWEDGFIYVSVCINMGLYEILCVKDDGECTTRPKMGIPNMELYNPYSKYNINPNV
jgi:hypothetical protein